MALNYRSLRYFWSVARLGTIREAAAELHVSEPAVSAQVRKLQKRLGVDLFEKRGRRLGLTEDGRIAFEYADEIFRLGDELTERMNRGQEAARTSRLTVGLTPGVSKMLVQFLLAPVVRDESIGLLVAEGGAADLVGQLATHRLDVVIADGAVPVDPGIGAHMHLLGASGVSFFAGGDLAGKLEGAEFPDDLDRAPWLLPTPGAPLRRALNVWLSRNDLRPRVAAEFDDSALLITFGAAGDGVFTTPTAVEELVIERYRARLLGRTEEIRETFYAVSMESQIHHPGILMMERAARELFG